MQMMQEIHEAHTSSLLATYPMLAIDDLEPPPPDEAEILQLEGEQDYIGWPLETDLDDRALETHNSLSWWQKDMQQMQPMRPGAEGIQVGTVAAVQGVRRSIWYGKVLEVRATTVVVKWFDKVEGSSVLYEIPEHLQPDEISKGTIICNGVEMEVVPVDSGGWRYRTELPYEHIRDLAEGAEILPPLGTSHTRVRNSNTHTGQGGNGFYDAVKKIVAEHKS